MKSALWTRWTLSNKQTGWGIGVGQCDPLGGFIVSAEWQSLQIANLRRYTNSADDAALELREFNCTLHVATPGSRRAYIVGRIPEAVRRRRMPIRRSPHAGWCWELEGRVLEKKEAASTVMRILLDRIRAARDAAGRGYGDGRPEDTGSYEPDE